MNRYAEVRVQFHVWIESKEIFWAWVYRQLSNKSMGIFVVRLTCASETIYGWQSGLEWVRECG